MRYQAQALELIKKLPKFDKTEFEDYMARIQIAAGGNNIFQYLDEKKRWNNEAVLSETSIKNQIVLSAQAQGVVNYLDSFDEEDFKKWFRNSISINISDVMTFVENKERARQQLKIIPPDLKLQ